MNHLSPLPLFSFAMPQNKFGGFIAFMVAFEVIPPRLRLH
jgi:hypothetical protein